MNDFVISPAWILGLLKQYWRQMVVSYVVGVLFVGLVYLILPRVYMAQTLVYISGNYFQNPLLGELISQSGDSSELKSERERILKESLGAKFLTAEGEKFHLFSTDAEDPARGGEIEGLGKSIDTMMMSPTEFSIKIKARSGEAADGLVRDAIEAIRSYMYQHRLQTFQQILEVLSGEIANTAEDEVGRVRARVGAGGLSPSAKAQLTAQIEVAKTRLDDMLHTYNEQHPAVLKAKADLAELRAAERGQASTFFQRRSGGPDGKDSAISADSGIKDELTRKKHLVNIALEIERHDATMSQYFGVVEEPMFPKMPIFPKRLLFVIIAVLFGGVSAVGSVAAREFWARSAQSPDELRATLKTEILGTLVIRPGRSPDL